MSSQKNRRSAAILRSIEILEEKANRIHSQYTTISDNDVDQLPTIPIDDTNTYLQIFFQHLEQLLQIDLRNRKSLLNTKRNYWHFFALALKESKGLYDTVLYVANSQEVKTSTGRGRLFLRFCLQHHRLGDVIQQSFMTEKVVHQFYADDCFWTKPTYVNRIVLVLYQLNDVQFNLLSNGQYQLDVCWPSAESVDVRLRNSYDPAARLRTNSISSCLSMESLASHSLLSSSIPIIPSSFFNLESSMNLDGSYVHSISSLDEDQENSILRWKERYHELESQLASSSTETTSKDVDVQCSIAQNDQITQTADELAVPADDARKLEQEKSRVQIETLQDEIRNLNFQLSSFIIQQKSMENKIKNGEREVLKYQALIDTKSDQVKELQQQLEEQSNQIKSIQKQHTTNTKRQEQCIETLTAELARINQALLDERSAFDRERSNQKKLHEQLEASIQEKTLDFEEMKRRLVKAIQEKADLFNSIHSYEVKLEEEQSKQWVHDDDVLNCTKCQTAFGWTLRKYRCRHCQKIFCYYCSNHTKPSSTTSPSQHRLCDLCHEIFVKESLRSNYTLLEDPNEEHQAKTGPDLNFEVRSERLATPTDTPTTDS